MSWSTAAMPICEEVALKQLIALKQLFPTCTLHPYFSFKTNDNYPSWHLCICNYLTHIYVYASLVIIGLMLLHFPSHYISTY